MNILSFVGKKKVWAFVGGVAAGLVLPVITKSKTVHNITVKALAKGMSLKDEANAVCESLKEDAQDIYAEAKQKKVNGDAPEKEEIV